jgi:cytochrome c-type biogenesis protein
MGDTFAGVASGGPLVLAFGVAALAGLVSFLSPCVLPLVPGYVSYVTGLAGADLADALDRPDAGARGRVLLGVGGFVAGFTVVFALTGVVVAEAGRVLLRNARVVELVAGLLVIGLGLAFLGLVPWLQRERRLRRLPAAGLAGAPLLGVVFGLSWTPCVSPTLTAVLVLGMGGSTPRALFLTLAYCAGLGLPFLVFGLAFRKLIGLHRAVRRHNVWVTRFGGAMLIAVGLALATGGWNDFVIWLKTTVGPGVVGI